MEKNLTPREKIREQARKLYPNTATHPMESANFCGFTAGGAYGYNLAIENMVEWLKKDLIETKDRDGHPSIESRSCRTVDEFINEFKQAMKL